MTATTNCSASWPAGPSGAAALGVPIASVHRDAIATIAVRLAILAGGFASSVLTARVLRPSGRGEDFLVITVAQTIAQFGTFGLQSSNTYLVARNPSLAGPLLANSLWLALISGGAGAIVAGVAASMTSRPTALSLLAAIAALGSASLFYMLSTNLLVGLKRIRAFNAYQLASNYGVLVCLFIAAGAGAGPFGFVAAASVAWTVVSVYLLFAVRHELAANLGFRWDVFRDGLRYALKAYVATACGFLVMRSNVFLLTALQTSEDVGHYSVATQLADVVGILPQSIALVMFPSLVSASAGRFRLTLSNMAVGGLVLGLACGAIGVFADPFVPVVFGPDFAAAVPVLRWMLPAAFFFGLTSMLSQYLAASGFPLSLVAVWLGGAGASVMTGWMLIPRFGGVGAAMAQSLTYAAIFLSIFGLSVLHTRRRSASALDAAQGAVS